MRTIAIVPGSKGIQIVDRPVPSVQEPNDVALRILQVGICGTDREEVAGGRAQAPDGHTDLVIGHEMLGQVIETGKAVSRVQLGDYAVFTVRRGCNDCIPCKLNRSDMCQTGRYRERGIWGLDGYQAECVVDKEEYIVQVPDELSSIGVLTEPLSVTEKAIDEALLLQSVRLPQVPPKLDWFVGTRCLVAGLGPIGLLAAMALRLRGAKVYGLDVVDATTARPQWLIAIDGEYIDGRRVPPEQVEQEIGAMNLILDATGIASLEFNLLDALAPNGIYVLTGIPSGQRPLEIQGAELIRRLVLENQVMAGSVNAARDHFQMAVDDLARAHHRWPGHVEKLITHRYIFSQLAAVFTEHPADEIKAVMEWGKPG